MDEGSSRQSAQIDLEMDHFDIEPPSMDPEGATAAILRGKARYDDPEWITRSPTKSEKNPSPKPRPDLSRRIKSIRGRTDGKIDSPSVLYKHPSDSFTVTASMPNHGREGSGESKSGDKKFCWPFLYGNTSVWHSIMYGKMESSSEEDDKDHPTSDAVCALLLIFLLLATSAIVLYFQIKSWPHVTDSYTTDDPFDNMRGGKHYVCGCSLPANLQNADNSASKTTNLNVCHEPNDLETVTVLMFSNSTAAKHIHELIKDNSDTRPVNKTVEGGFSVTQQADELTVQNITVYDSLNRLYLGNKRQPDIHPNINYLLGSNFNDYPTAYLQMNWLYECATADYACNNNLGALSNQVLSSNESWVNCYDYGVNGTLANGHYQCKCVLYPPQTLPASLAIQSFLGSVMKTSAVSNITSDLNDPTLLNTTALLPSVLYLNISKITNSLIQMGFVEVDKGTALWSSLLSYFHSIENECSDLPPVQICNGTSVCNVFTSANSYELKCLNFMQPSDCDPIKHKLTPDNTVTGNGFSDIICPSSMNCTSIPPYLVIWSESDSSKNYNTALNSFLVSRLLNEEWMQRSGVCVNTYKDVVRAPQPIAGATNETEIFLETRCTNATVNQAAYCWVTGNYHYLSDLPPTRTWMRLPENLYQATGNRFVCYRLDRQKFISWFITSCGILFGWIGSINMVFYAMFYWLFVPARKRLRGS
ncbi:unnamed protein product [Calypogeia fissa]